MADEGRRGPYVGYNFRMEIDGVEVAGFREISGLKMNTEVVEYFDHTMDICGFSFYRLRRKEGPSTNHKINSKDGVINSFKKRVKMHNPENVVVDLYTLPKFHKKIFNEKLEEIITNYNAPFKRFKSNIFLPDLVREDLYTI